MQKHLCVVGGGGCEGTVCVSGGLRGGSIAPDVEKKLYMCVLCGVCDGGIVYQ